MRGAIAAGADSTAEAGAEILRSGGNAVDAAVAACFAVAAGEPTLTSLAGAGALLFRAGDSGAVTICDFFANAPGLGPNRPARLDFSGIELDFGPARQVFHVGAGSAAVPGVIPGLCTAHERWGRLPLEQVVAPACRVLREGVVLDTWQGRAVKLLEEILLLTDAGRAQFAPEGHLVGAGDRYRLPALADTLEQLAAGWRDYYDDVIGGRIVAQFGPEAGGLLSAEDLAAFRVEFRSPLRGDYRGCALHMNPPPAAGGQMIGLMLALLDGTPSLGPHGGREALHTLCRAMRVADEARASGDGAFDVGRLERWVERFRALEGRPLAAAPPASPGPGSTTHVSVIDGEGNAAAVTFSYGEGNGVIIDGTGIMMNNLMGEEDLFPGGFHSWPAGARLSTMMSPTLLVTPEGDVTVLGTGGSNRIRTAMTQVISNLVDHDLPVGEAVTAPRVHFEGGVLNAEVFDAGPRRGVLEGLGANELIVFDEPNLFFGGVHLVRRRADGTLEGAGDPRRGGTCRVV